MRSKFVLVLALVTALIGAEQTSAAISPAATSAGEDQAAAMAMQGRRVFLRCASCHVLGDVTIKKIGPNLQNVVGRKAGTLPGYAYSPALRAANITWDDAMLDRWLSGPNAVAPGTSMAFAGLPKPEDRKAVIAYLKTH